MRKWSIAFVITCLFLSFITASHASYDGVKLGNYPRNSILYQDLKNDRSLQLLNHIIILPKDTFSQEQAAVIINRIDLLPYSLLRKINNHSITLKLFTGRLTDNPTARQLAGQIPRGYHSKTTWDDVPGIGGSKVVLVKIGCSNTGQGHGSVNLELHELAHSIDRIVFDNITSTKEFKNVWQQEHERLFPGNSYFLYPEEYFAETFAMFYLNKDTKQQLQENAPKTFEFITKLQ